jgi:hypothetical protein
LKKFMTAIQGAASRALIGHHPDLTSAPAVSSSHSIEYRALADGDSGTFQTLEAMKDAVLGRIGPDYSGYRDSFVCRAAHSICAKSGCSGQAQIAALFDFVARQIKYEAHPIDQQVLQDARRTIEIGSGDCVSKSVLLATLLACFGHKPFFIAQWVDGVSASHVYVGLNLNGEELRLDPVAEDEPMGWSQPLLDGGFERAWRIF